MTVAIAGAYRSVKQPLKVHVVTDQKHILKLDGAAGTASITMDNKEYETNTFIYKTAPPPSRYQHWLWAKDECECECLKEREREVSASVRKDPQIPSLIHT